MHYFVTPVPLRDRTDLDVEVRFAGSWPKTLKIAPPINCYGSAFDLSSSLVSLEAAGGRPLAKRDLAAHSWLLSRPSGGGALRYRLSFDPVNMERDAFSPNSGGTHFHVAGCQWMLTLGDMRDTREVTVEFVGVPSGWSVYSSLAPAGGMGRIVGNEDQTAPTAIGGQLRRPRVFEVAGRPVEAFVADGFSFASDEIAGWVQDIVQHQRTRMGVFDFPFYTVAVRPRADVIAGTAIDNLFIAFIQPDATKSDIVRNISHEMFHSFIPDRLSLTSPEGADWARHLWFSEGVVEYMARALSMERGLSTMDELAARLNRDLRDLAENPYSRWPIEKFEEAYKRDGWLSQTMKNVSYARGAVLAAQWDHQLRKRGQTDLASLLRGMLALDGDTLPENCFFDMLEKYGIPASADFGRYVAAGEQLVPDAALLSPSYELRKLDVASFDPGFDLSASVQSKVLTAVDTDGPGFAAGLKEGMSFARLENASRFSSSWNELKPLVVVTIEDDRERRFAFMPKGKVVGVHQFLRSQRAKRQMKKG